MLDEAHDEVAGDTKGSLTLYVVKVDQPKALDETRRSPRWTTHLGETLLETLDHDIQRDTATRVRLRVEEDLGMFETVRGDALEVGKRERRKVALVDQDVHRLVEVGEKVVEVGKVAVSSDGTVFSLERSKRKELLILTVLPGPRWSSTWPGRA